MKGKSRDIFTTIHTEGGLLPSDLLQRILEQDKDLGGLTNKEYHLDEGVRLQDATTNSWNRLVKAWSNFQESLEKLPENDVGTALTREKWLLILFDELGYGRLPPHKSALQIQGKDYPISHHWSHSPIHLIGARIEMDKRTPGVAGAAKASPHGMVQDFLNRSDEDLWGFVSNGLKLRILRDNVSLTRAAYVEFDLESMMKSEAYSDFRILWLVCHQSRVEADPPESCWLEKWMNTAQEQGTRALDQLRIGVENAIRSLGQGFLSHPDNKELRDKLKSGALNTQDYYRQLLRLVYRLIFLFVTEERDLLLQPGTDRNIRQRYEQYYSMRRLRELVRKHRGTRHSDVYHSLRAVMDGLKSDTGFKSLGLPPLNSFLWSSESLLDIESCTISNSYLYEAIRNLAFTNQSGAFLSVDYKNLGTEELGSIYESLLELRPDVDSNTGGFELRIATGHERRSSGSYYTPRDLIKKLLDTALEPIIEEAIKKPHPEEALLKIKVCDPAAGSGHFLIAAGHRIAKKLAAIRTDVDEPSPEEIRKDLREVVSHCLYGVDKNPMAVELCKVSLWLETLNPGKPLSFLDHAIKCGDSLVGVVDIEVLEKGIPDEAYKRTRPEEKEAAAILKKRNKEEKKGVVSLDRPQWHKDITQIADSIDELANASDDSIARIAEKSRRYTDMRNRGSEYWKKNTALHLYTSPFFMDFSKDNAVPTTDMIRQYLCPSNQISDSILSNIYKESDNINHPFFHWVMEFPEIFSTGGFDVILSNPPFLGGKKISGNLGDDYLNYINETYSPIGGLADLCTYFFRRAFEILKQNGNMGMVATKTISEGDTREGGLHVIIGKGGNIIFAQRFIKWPGDATVEVNILTIHKGFTKIPRMLIDGRSPRIVNNISTLLTDENDFQIYPLLQNKSKAFQGSIVHGMGFVLERQEAEELLTKDNKNRDCIFPFLNGEDINSDPNQLSNRWVINFDSWPLTKAKEYPDLIQIVENRVKPLRENIKRERNKKRWWIYAETRPGLYKSISKLKQVLVRALTSDSHMMTFVPNNIVYSHAVGIFSFDDYYHFTVLQSNIHETWLRRQASKLRTDIRYTPSDCFETFPFPQMPSEKNIEKAEKIGMEYYELRKQSLLTRNIGLTKLYHLFHTAEQNEDDIQNLRELHRKMDISILTCYSWSDINPNHGFYENERGQIRFTISSEAKKEIIRRLICLNNEIHIKEYQSSQNNTVSKNQKRLAEY